MGKGLKKREILFFLIIGVMFFVVIGKYYPLGDFVRMIEMEYRTSRYREEFGSTLVAPSLQGFAKSIPVLTYHGIVERPDGANVILSEFKDQMLALKREGWQTISFEDFFAFMQGERHVPDKSFLLTFDDGQKLSYYPVDPILRVLGFRAVNFVITRQSLGKGTSYYLSKRELVDMLKSGRWEIQVHARDAHELIPIDSEGNGGHFLSNKMWLEDVHRLETSREFKDRILGEFISAKRELEDSLGVRVIGYAYPFGDFGQGTVNYPEARKIISEAIRSVFPLYQAYQVWEGGGYIYNYPDVDKDNFLVKRISVKPEWTANDLVGVLTAGKEKHLPYIDDLVFNRGWRGVSARVNVYNGEFLLTPDAGSTSAMAFLDGSAFWKDYLYAVYVQEFNGKTLSLVFRYRDNDNHARCDYKLGSVGLTVRENGQDRMIVERKSSISQLSNLAVGVLVKENVARCITKNGPVMFGVLPESLATGGVGLKIWDSATGSASLVTTGLTVE